jgi:hypothetical protein
MNSESKHYSKGIGLLNSRPHLSCLHDIHKVIGSAGMILEMQYKSEDDKLTS